MNGETARATKEELTSIIERIERLDAEKADIAQARKDILSEAQSRGYEPKPINLIIAERKREPSQVSEEQAIVELYKSALMP